jgi:hypothetical protein
MLSCCFEFFIAKNDISSKPPQMLCCLAELLSVTDEIERMDPAVPRQLDNELRNRSRSGGLHNPVSGM